MARAALSTCVSLVPCRASSVRSLSISRSIHCLRLVASPRLAGGEPRDDSVPCRCGAVPTNGVESTPLSNGSVGDNVIGWRLAVDLENGRDGENGGLVPAPCRPIDVREPAVSRVPGEPSIGADETTHQAARAEL